MNRAAPSKAVNDVHATFIKQIDPKATPATGASTQDGQSLSGQNMNANTTVTPSSSSGTNARLDSAASNNLSTMENAHRSQHPTASTSAMQHQHRYMHHSNPNANNPSPLHPVPHQSPQHYPPPHQQHIHHQRVPHHNHKGYPQGNMQPVMIRNPYPYQQPGAKVPQPPNNNQPGPNVVQSATPMHPSMQMGPISPQWHHPMVDYPYAAPQFYPNQPFPNPAAMYYSPLSPQGRNVALPGANASGNVVGPPPPSSAVPPTSGPLSPNSVSSGPSTPSSSIMGGRPPNTSSVSSFQPGPQKSKAIPIVNPTTKTQIEIDRSAVSSKSASPNTPGNLVIKMDRSVSSSKSPTSPAPTERTEAEKERIKKSAADAVAALAAAAKAQEQEKVDRETKEKTERDEKEKSDRDAKEKLEREAKEEVEREAKEKIERETLEESERKRKEEEVQKAKEEAERREKEEVEKREKEEVDRKAKEAADKQEKEEAELKAKETALRKKEEEEVKPEEKVEPQDKKEKSDESAMSNPSTEKKVPRIKPDPLDISKAQFLTPGIPSAPLSALGSARIIDDINKVEYPKNVQSPRPELNANAAPGKFKYDRDFLLQFMQVCKEKPDSLPSLDAIGMLDDLRDAAKSPSFPRKNAPGGRSGSHPGFGNMGEFSRPPKTSEERFAASIGRGGLGGPGSIRGSMGPRTASSGSLLPGGAGSRAVPSSPGGRTRSGRGSQRGGPKGGPGVSQQGGSTIPPDQVTPLEVSENRWLPVAMQAKSKKVENEPIDVIQRKVKALLNKLTVEKFEPISNQIIEYANKSVNETDGSSLRTVIQLTFLKATDEPGFSAMYAKLCRKMWDMVNPNISDEAIIGQDGKPVSGSQLFRKYLLNRCQEDFERGWKTLLPKKELLTEADMMTEEYYTAQKAKRRGLGLVKLIGELYRLDMLTERIMHQCIKRLLTNVVDPEEEEVESVCKLLTTIGSKLDHERSKGHIDIYFERLRMMQSTEALTSRVRYMIQDVIELRQNQWVPRRDQATAKTIAEIHEEAQRKKDEAEAMKRSTSSSGRGGMTRVESMGRGGSRRGQHRDAGVNAPLNDGWSTVGGGGSGTGGSGGSGATIQKAGSLNKFGLMRTKSGTQSLGPPSTQSHFAGLRGRDFSKDGGTSRTDMSKEEDHQMSRRSSSQSSNMFALLNSQEPTNVPERPKFKLLPRSKRVDGDEEEDTKDAGSEASTPIAVDNESAGDDASNNLSDEEGNRRIKNMIAEFWSIKDIKEAVLCLGDLSTSELRVRGIKSFVDSVLDKKQADIDLLKQVFAKARDDKVIDEQDCVGGFKEIVEMVDDLSIDVPSAYNFVGQLLAGGARLSLKLVLELVKPLADIPNVVPPQARMVAEFLQAVQSEAGDSGVEGEVEEAKLDFKSLFPEDERSDEKVQKLLDKYELGIKI